jgi:hypothetical protein
MRKHYVQEVKAVGGGKRLMAWLDSWRVLQSQRNGGKPVSEEQVYDWSGISKGVFTGWRGGAQPKPATVRKLAEATGEGEYVLFTLAGYPFAEWAQGEYTPEEIQLVKLWRGTRCDLRRVPLRVLQEVFLMSQG